jgi:hypothetical protein
MHPYGRFFGYVDSILLHESSPKMAFRNDKTGESVPNFDIAQYYESGENQDLLIRSQRLGAALAAEFSTDPNNNNTLPDGAQTNANHAVVLMQNHGFTTVASDIKLAVMQAVYTQVDAGIQTTAMTIQSAASPSEKHRGLAFLTTRQAAESWKTMSGTIDRPWGLWTSEVVSCGLYQNLLGSSGV